MVEWDVQRLTDTDTVPEAQKREKAKTANTAVVEEDGSVHFFDDIYGYDKTLEAVLAKGQPYPG